MSIANSDMRGSLLSSRQSLTLDLPPSCLAFCPAHPDYFVVGTYYLEAGTGHHYEGKASQSRNGSLIVFRLADNGVSIFHTLKQESAVLDLRFSSGPHTGDICAVVDSTAGLKLFRLFPDLAQPLEQLLSYRIPGIETNVLFLSCVWHPTVAHIIALSTSTGEIHVLNLSDNLTAVLCSQGPILRHSLEAWCVALAPQPSIPAEGEASRFTLCSGADDSMLQLAECELADFTSTGGLADFDVQLLGPPVMIVGHTAGVTAILPLPFVSDDGLTIFITGSYDEKVRVYATRSGGAELSPQRSHRLLSELVLGGGVWRMNLISWHQDSRVWRAVVLASCMHAGARIIEIASDGGSSSSNIAITVKARFEEHESMNYASDFQPSLSGTGKLVCISTSFYDRLLCLWEVTLHTAMEDETVVEENDE